MLEEAQALINRGYQITFVCNPGSPLALQAVEKKIPVLGLRMRKSYQITSAIQFFSLLKGSQVDLLHIHNSKDHWICGLPARLLHVPTVRSRDVGVPVKMNSISSLMYLRCSGRIIVSSDAIRRDLLRIPNLEANRIVTIPSGVDLTRFHPLVSPEGVRKELALPDASSVIGCIARLDEAKGHEILLQAASSIVKVHPSVRFLLVGDGPGRTKARLKQLATDLGLGLHVIFTGFRTDIPQLIAAMTFVVVPSFCIEGIPQVILQALAIAKPVIATCVGGIPEIITDGVNGMLIKPKNVAELTKAMLWMLAHPQQANVMGRCGREKVARAFTLDHAVSRTEAVYKGLL